MSPSAPAAPTLSRRDRSRRHRGLWWAAIGALLFANLAVLTVFLGLRQVDAAVEQAIRTEAVQDEEVVSELTPSPAGPSQPRTFLVIGSDSREGLDDLSGFGDFGGSRADVVMLIQLLPAEGRAQVLSLPRDLWVPIEGHGSNRINAAYAFGGAPLLVDTVKRVTGSPVHNYVEIDFVGFQAIVDQLGGVTIDFPYAARDAKSGFSVEAGTQRLDGAQALAFVRARSYQENRDGRWVTDGSGDIGRTGRQQQLLLAILDQLARPSNVFEMGNVVRSFARHLTVDATFADQSIVELAFAMRGLRSDDIDRATLPAVGDNIGGRSVLLPQEPEASAMLTAFREGSPLVPEQASTGSPTARSGALVSATSSSR
jgi:polyisoprenyl-teichoic acid--peptidoglycan teichoic acid transferase